MIQVNSGWWWRPMHRRNMCQKEGICSSVLVVLSSKFRKTFLPILNNKCSYYHQLHCYIFLISRLMHSCNSSIVDQFKNSDRIKNPSIRWSSISLKAQVFIEVYMYEKRQNIWHLFADFDHCVITFSLPIIWMTPQFHALIFPLFTFNSLERVPDYRDLRSTNNNPQKLCINKFLTFTLI